MRRDLLAAAALAFSTFLLTGCGDDGASPPNRGVIEVTLVRGSATAPAQDSGTDGEPQAGVVPVQAVASILVRITAVEALLAGADEENDANWVRLELVDDEVDLDLLALPEEEEDGILLARGEIEEGLYSNLRIRYSEAAITLDGDVTIGGHTMPGGTHELQIPSGAQTGIKVPSASFAVEDGDAETVTLVFDGNASVQTIVVAGPPTEPWLQMSPVLTRRIP